MCSIIASNFKIGDLDHVNYFLKFRGPDHTGELLVNGWHFVHNLLSITGEFRPQPLTSPNGDIVCLFNGEIYNYKTFGDFASDGDCIIPCYEQYGHDFTRLLDGEFAIVLIDFRRKSIFLGTDVFSTKPLWVGTDGSRVMFASYESALERSGLPDRQKVPANRAISLNIETLETERDTTVYDFDLTQHKHTYDDWVSAWEASINKRTRDIRERIFVGLSSGYDSGAIACELKNQDVPFKTYSIKAQENEQVLEKRFNYHDSDFDYVRFTKSQFSACKRAVQERCENFIYRIYFNGESVYSDKASAGLAHICELANRDGIKIYLSGQGADEIYSDYGFGGQKFYPHSSFGGLYPQQLEQIFPWKSFYEGTQISYLAKEESVAGGFGIEGRYPFLDTKLVQEFLWLSPELKNREYKSVIDHFLTLNEYPFDKRKKIGFSCDKNLAD